ncbi:IS66 family insertion sequence element accessory protein TnpA [Enterobacter mori]|uniref:IS66 family insertion sequence element accessory protein TnpA n=1 Tax=Enterobacter mori TaxID=539813 RepID=UPI002ED5B80A|nr:IS66 family insertion sequence element accessory protein TnpB [Enterobacter mori]
MPTIRWTLDQKKHHVAAWRASGLTREQYCDLYDIPVKSLRQWPQDVAKAEQRANAPDVIPVRVSEVPADIDTAHQHATAVNEPVTLFLPGGIRMCCHPSQLTDVFRALKYADA